MKRIPVPEHIASLRVYVPGKPVEEVQRELGLRRTAKLASNENPLGPSPLAVRAMRKALRSSHRYPDGSGFYLKARISEATGYGADQIVLGNGSTELVELLAKTFLRSGENAVVSEGAFVMYRIAVMAVGAPCREVPMGSDLRHDLRAMAGVVDARTRLVYIANPNNPTGNYVTDAELERFLGLVPEDVIVVLDEAYREYMTRSDYPDSDRHLRGSRPLVVLRTFSKIYGLAGLRVGYALTRADIASTLERVRSPFNTSSLGQIAATAALDDVEHVSRSRAANAAGLAFLERGLSRLGIPFTRSVGNFVLVHPPCEPQPLSQRLLRSGVIVRPMAGFGFPGSFRVSVGTMAENRRFLRALQDGLRPAIGEPA